MKLPRLPMGCLSSRSTIVPSEERVENTGQKTKLPSKQQQLQSQSSIQAANNELASVVANGDLRSKSKGLIGNKGNEATGRGDNNDKDQNSKRLSVNSSTEIVDDDMMSIIMNDEEKSENQDRDGVMKLDDNYKSLRSRRPLAMEDKSNMNLNSELNRSLDGGKEIENSNVEGSFDEEPNLDLLRQYVAIDYEITLLEDKDALRVYHEKIEQLEQLERELDMISSEAEEVAARSETGTQLERDQSAVNGVGGPQNDFKMDLESNSLISGASGSMSRKSWNNGNGTAIANNGQRNGGGGTTVLADGSNKNEVLANNLRRSGSRQMQQQGNKKNGSTTGSHLLSGNRHFNNLSYSTVEEVFNRKIILEKERDKLKKEVEMVIVECDKLQQRYKKRDEILDKLFDGRTGNGLENHLEQQLNWLLEQKHYVDQVFYAWKRAETLTSQTCEQFTNALELLKRLPKVEDPEQRSELIKSIGDLLIKSRQDIEQAQQYNPNVDAPFFTDNETERFDSIIESISTNSISPSDYSQVLTVIQFAYKRAVSIRLWLEQILQTTIARDSFELAEEYKWIAIQLRKERINLIKSKLQSPQYQPMVQSIQEQSITERRQHEINRDSGIESETNDIDIEEEIYRLLELNRSRLEMATGNGSNNNPNASGKQASSGEPPQPSAIHHHGSDQKLKVTTNQSLHMQSAPSSSDSNKDQKMRDRIQKRVKGEQPLLLDKMPAPSSVLPPSGASFNHQQPTGIGGNNSVDAHGNDLNSSIGTPTRLKIELDEEAKQSLLKQVGQVHLQHKSKIERIRGNNKAKAADLLMNRMQQVRETQLQTGR